MKKVESKQEQWFPGASICSPAAIIKIIKKRLIEVASLNLILG